MVRTRSMAEESGRVIAPDVSPADQRLDQIAEEVRQLARQQQAILEHLEAPADPGRGSRGEHCHYAQRRPGKEPEHHEGHDETLSRNHEKDNARRGTQRPDEEEVISRRNLEPRAPRREPETEREPAGGHDQVADTPNPNDQLREMKDQLDRMMQMVKGQFVTNSEGEGKADITPFTPPILETPLPPKFKMPYVEHFDGSTDPLDHLDNYKTTMILHALPDAIMCRAFPSTLRGAAKSWFTKLRAGSVGSFDQLGKLFISHFVGGRRHRKSTAALLEIKQSKEESLRSYLARFNQETLQVEGADDRMMVAAFISGLRPGGFLFALAARPPTSMAELIQKAEEQMNGEEVVAARRAQDAREFHRPEKRSREREARPPVPIGDRNRYRGAGRPTERRGDIPGEYHFTPLNTSLDRVLMHIRRDPEINWPAKMRTPPEKRSRHTFCEYHGDHGHNTNSCFQLKEEVERLVQKGRLAEFVTNPPRRGADRPDPPNRRSRSPRRERSPRPREERRDVPHPAIHAVAGGFAGGGSSSSARKAHAKRLKTDREQTDDQVVGARESDVRRYQLVFSDEDKRSVQYPHDDPVVIRALIGNFLVKRILVDSGSSADILSAAAFDQMGIGRNKLAPFSTPLMGFSGEKAYALGTIRLPVTLGDEHQATHLLTFLVVDTPPAYNAILGRPALNQFEAAVSTFHLAVKFPTAEGVGSVKGDQVSARECYLTSLKGNKRATQEG